MGKVLIIISFIILQNSWLWEFKKHPDNPVVPHGEDGEWDDTYAIDGHLLGQACLGDEDTVKIYYVGYNGEFETSFPCKGIGYSYSIDFGNTWNKYSGNPVFVSDSSGWERESPGTDGLWEAAMRKQGGLYQMWYQAKDSTNHQNTLYATSEDGIHWVRRNNGMPVLRADLLDWRWDSWWAGARNVIQVEDSFYLFYEGIQLGCGPISLGLAVGPNETTFVKVDTLPVFSPKNTDDTLWCGNGMLPNVIYMNSTFVLFYCAGDFDRTKQGVGIAFSKGGRNWRRYKRNPVYECEVGEPGAWDSLSIGFINVENIGSETDPVLWGVYRGRGADTKFSLGLVTIDAKDLVPPSAPTLIIPHNGAIISNSKPEFYYRGEDNFSGIEYYILEYQQAFSEPCSIEIEDTVYIPSVEFEDGIYIWRAKAIDCAGWESNWSTRTFTIDTKAPQITETTLWDSAGFAGPFPVYSKITDENGVGKAELYYKISSDTNWTSILMDKDGDQYSGAIPSQTETTTISYYVYAEDKAGPPNKSFNPPDAPDSCFSFAVCSVSEGGIWGSFFVALVPNPATRHVTIKYHIPLEGRVLLKIYDVSGSVVKVLIDEDINPGYHNINWDAEDLGCGIYFVKFYVVPKYKGGKEYRAVRKLILVK